MTRRLTGRAARGFTLIETMIVVAVIGILVGIAYPAYQDQLRKGRRADAQAVLMEASQFMERFHSENFRYDQDLAAAAIELPAAMARAPKEGSTVYYVVSLQAVEAQGYILQAVPEGAQATDDCGTMTLDNIGRKGGERSDCWRR